MAQNFWTAIYAWTTCFVVTILVSLRHQSSGGITPCGSRLFHDRASFGRTSKLVQTADLSWSHDLKQPLFFVEPCIPVERALMDWIFVCQSECYSRFFWNYADCVRAFSNPALYVQSLGININLNWGVILLIFGLIMLFLGARAMFFTPRATETPTTDDRAPRN